MKRPVPMLANYEHVGGSLGVLATPGGNLPLAALSLTGRITGLFYRVMLRQTFLNPHSQTLEATCIFPLPGRAGVFGFRMRAGSRVVEGRLEDRAAARQQYGAGLKAGHLAGLAEQERAEVFTLQVGNVPPGGSVILELELGGPLDYSREEVSFRFPLVVAPREIPGTALPGPSVGAGFRLDTDAVPDASRISPPVLLRGQPSPVHLNLELELDPAGLPFRELRSSLHALEWCRNPEGFFLLSLAPGVDRLDRDLILRLGLKAEAIVSSFVVLPDAAASHGGTFAVTLVPPGLPAAPGARKVVFLLDRSASMAGWKLALACRALMRLAAGLSEQDHLAVVLMDAPPEELLPLTAASEVEKTRLSSKLGRLAAQGRAELGPALGLALQRSADTIVLITGGHFGNERQILDYFAQVANRVRLHALAVDRAANVEFLRALSERSGGTLELVEAEERLEQVLPELQQNLRSPLLSRLRLQGFEALEVAPDPLPDLFRGQPLSIFGRYQGPPPRAVTVVGVAGGREHARPIAAASGHDSVLRTTWARTRLLDLEYRFDIGAEPAARVRDFSLQWGVLSRFTALVAVDLGPWLPGSGPIHQVVQGVELPSGWEPQAAEEPPEVSFGWEDFSRTPELAEAVPLDMATADSLFGGPAPLGEAAAEFGAPPVTEESQFDDFFRPAAPASTSLPEPPRPEVTPSLAVELPGGPPEAEFLGPPAPSALSADDWFAAEAAPPPQAGLLEGPPPGDDWFAGAESFEAVGPAPGASQLEGPAPGPEHAPPEALPGPDLEPESPPPEPAWEQPAPEEMAGSEARARAEAEVGWLRPPEQDPGVWLGVPPQPAVPAPDDWLKVSPVMESVPPLTAAAGWGDDWFSGGVGKPEEPPAATPESSPQPPAPAAAPALTAPPAAAPAPPAAAAPALPTVRPRQAPAPPEPEPSAPPVRAGLMAAEFRPPGGPDDRPVLMRRPPPEAAARKQDRKQRILDAFQTIQNEILRKILERMELDELILALHWCNEPLVQRICQLLGEPRARMFRHKMGQVKKMTPAAVEAAQGKFLRLVNQLAS